MTTEHGPEPTPGSPEILLPSGGTRPREVSPALAHALLGTALPWVADFADRAYEWRRLFAEVLGTFLLVVVAAGGGVVSAATGGEITRTAEVVAPALMVTAVILSIGAISGAHLGCNAHAPVGM